MRTTRRALAYWIADVRAERWQEYWEERDRVIRGLGEGFGILAHFATWVAACALIVRGLTGPLGYDGATVPFWAGISIITGYAIYLATQGSGDDSL